MFIKLLYYMDVSAMQFILLTVIGLVILLLGAEALVRGSSALAYRLGMRPLLIGMTVVAFGTSMPEMMVSVRAAFSGQDGISIGNVIGSNICNLGLILGISAIIQPLKIQSQTVRMDVPVMIMSGLLITLFFRSSGLSRIEGGLLLVFMGTFIGYSLAKVKHDKLKLKTSDLGMGEIRYLSLSVILLYIFAGLAGLIVGAQFLIHGAVGLARTLGVSETLIGLTLVAVGTSLPELATSAIAAMRKEADIAVGNIIGSNIFNTLAILGLTSLLKPIRYIDFPWVSFLVMNALFLICLPFLKSGFRLSRTEGFVFLVIYCGYIYFLLH